MVFGRWLWLGRLLRRGTLLGRLMEQSSFWWWFLGIHKGFRINLHTGTREQLCANCSSRWAWKPTRQQLQSPSLFIKLLLTAKFCIYRSAPWRLHTRHQLAVDELIRIKKTLAINDCFIQVEHQIWIARRHDQKQEVVMSGSHHRHQALLLEKVRQGSGVASHQDATQITY